ncbi:glutamate racemase [Xenophilus arseniciresistens]|uniref:Glutamate racemase n=1 Tax=Xenophilus arseniciresistens TaxID=1283306 RepID=A0AAE3T131_9BURK|nr:glutamate racemase [Xenophilus arseniciresistens]MDA7417576.1 glutamate racemase [Xenophilus arseniciresistens]
MPPLLPSPDGSSPIGVFDSGVGGLSVLRALRALMPHEHFVYYADTAYAPYGERGDAYVIERTRAVTELLVRSHGIKALVVACNTATTAAIHVLRAEYPALPLVGLEPGLKPAVAATRTGSVAVLATRGTLASAKYAALQAAYGAQVQVRAVPCDGLVRAIEAFDDAGVAELCARYMEQAGPLGDAPGQADTVVLGCTHYPLVRAQLQAHAPAALRFIDTGIPVAQQTQRLLRAADLLSTRDAPGSLQLLSSGDAALLHQAAQRWLHAEVDARPNPAPAGA